MRGNFLHKQARIKYANVLESWKADEMIYRKNNLVERMWMGKTTSCLKGLARRLCRISIPAFKTSLTSLILQL